MDLGEKITMLSTTLTSIPHFSSTLINFRLVQTRSRPIVKLLLDGFCTVDSHTFSAVHRLSIAGHSKVLLLKLLGPRVYPMEDDTSSVMNPTKVHRSSLQLGFISFWLFLDESASDAERSAMLRCDIPANIVGSLRGLESVGFI